MPRQQPIGTSLHFVEPALLEDERGQFGYVVRQLWEWNARQRRWDLRAGGDVERVDYSSTWTEPDWPMFEAIRQHAAGGPPYVHAAAHYWGKDRKWHPADIQTNY